MQIYPLFFLWRNFRQRISAGIPSRKFGTFGHSTIIGSRRHSLFVNIYYIFYRIFLNFSFLACCISPVLSYIIFTTPEKCSISSFTLPDFTSLVCSGRVLYRVSKWNIIIRRRSIGTIHRAAAGTYALRMVCRRARRVILIFPAAGKKLNIFGKYNQL